MTTPHRKPTPRKAKRKAPRTLIRWINYYTSTNSVGGGIYTSKEEAEFLSSYLDSVQLRVLMPVRLERPSIIKRKHLPAIHAKRGKKAK